MSSNANEASKSELERLYDEGINYLKQREPKKASKQFTKAIKAYNSQIDGQNDLAVVHCARSAAYFHLKRYNEASADADESISIRPQWSKGYFRKAEILAGQNNAALALEYYRKALEFERDSKSIDVVELRILRLEDRMEIEQSNLYLAQLIPGHDICLGTYNPIKKLVFEFARGMQNLVYVIGDRHSKDCVIVDVCWDAEGVISEIEKNGLKPIGCIVTHNHFDHFGGKPPAPFGNFGITVQGVKNILSKYPAIPVYIHKDDADAFQNDSGIDPCRISATCDDQRLRIGRENEGIGLRFIHTPGHTPGAQCILIDETRLLTGDTLFVGSCGRMDLPGGCRIAMFNSLKHRLASLADTIKIYPGHSYGGLFVTTVNRERRLGALRSNTLEEWLRLVGGQPSQLNDDTCNYE